MKLTLNEFLELSADYVGRKLSAEEVESIEPCDCGKPFCSGWTAEFKIDSFFANDPRRLEV